MPPPRPEEDQELQTNPDYRCCYGMMNILNGAKVVILIHAILAAISYFGPVPEDGGTKEWIWFSDIGRPAAIFVLVSAILCWYGIKKGSYRMTIPYLAVHGLETVYASNRYVSCDRTLTIRGYPMYLVWFGICELRSNFLVCIFTLWTFLINWRTRVANPASTGRDQESDTLVAGNENSQTAASTEGAPDEDRGWSETPRHPWTPEFAGDPPSVNSHNLLAPPNSPVCYLLQDQLRNPEDNYLSDPE